MCMREKVSVLKVFSLIWWSNSVIMNVGMVLVCTYMYEFMCVGARF